MPTDLYEEMLQTTAQTIDKVIKYPGHIAGKVLTAVQMSPSNKNALFAGEFCWERFANVSHKAVNLCRKLADTYDETLKKYDVLIMLTSITLSTIPLRRSRPSP